MNKLYRLATVGLAAFLVGSCSTVSYVIFFNNTADALDFAVNSSKTREISPGQERRSSNSYWSCVENYCSRKIVIDRGGYRYSYTFGEARDELNRLSQYYVRKWHPARDEVKIQINSDGSLFIVRPEQAFPISPAEAQPSGFPLRPIDRSAVAEGA